MKIKKGSKIQVITGDNKGKTAVVLLVKGLKVIAEGVNLVKKSVKSENNEGKNFVNIPKPIHISNVKLIKSDTIVSENIKKKKK